MRPATLPNAVVLVHSALEPRTAEMPVEPEEYEYGAARASGDGLLHRCRARGTLVIFVRSGAIPDHVDGGTARGVLHGAGADAIHELVLRVAPYRGGCGPECEHESGAGR